MDSIDMTRSGLPSCSNDTVSLRNFRTPEVLLLNLFVEEKIRQMENVSEHIKRAKEGFLEKYDEINKKIKYLIEQLYCTAEQKKLELKNELEQIVTNQVLSWDRQLEICIEAEDWLKNLKTDIPLSSEFLQQTSDFYARDIGFIDSPEIILGGDTDVVENYSEEVGMESSERMSTNHRAEILEPKFWLGNKGRNIGEFNHPCGVCSDKIGRIFVADCCNNRIQVFNERGRFILEFGKFGTLPGYFNKPVGITVDKSSRILVTDQNNHRVQVFTSNGKFIFMFGQKGPKFGQFQYPCDVDTNSKGEIAVSDNKNRRVQLFKKKGIFLKEFGCKNSIQRPFCPCGIAFKPDDTLLVTDIKNSFIFIIDKTFSTATKVQGYMNFISPQGVACSSNGKFIIADSKQNKIYVFNEEGKLLRMFGRFGKHSGEFDNPQGICFHPSGSIIVAESGNNRIQMF